jgi:PPM family protein phosphatase
MSAEHQKGGQMPTVRAGAASDAGRVRETNEDCVFAGTHLFVVADGMGGHAAGEVASALTIARLALLSERADLKPEDIRRELALANEDILAAARQDPAQAGMGSTVAGLALAWFAGGRHWVVFNAGDCRVYRFADDTLSLLTVDHTEVGELIAAGLIDPADAATHPSRHVVTRALGSDPAPEPDLLVLPPTAEERFLLCSDGLFLELADADIAEVLRAEPLPDRAAQTLVRRALDRGGRDNVSAVVVDHVVVSDDGVIERTVPRSKTAVSR